ncbi:PREDICTED: probable leucine-rich repeat receptor-like protein kinase At5g49770 isoform X4 [Ipomoea nil]|uniref:probable leucine-rich repeat receptor-like protein kinase At5g49770 isoform X4 n=1 Tax=Ipomoea nil TaxID=35883 RepID=UPI000901C24B|nr:PREDICTED: probable leucine-rich repeat receptor-like protein kinase At5g49770 isoform X4 [Ipomoea nil]XP_019191079.1 PREDICTED: probable leucine-rich repeat receptor-like protein kinase At5g49770 isoform X4 [Ipomoea nil]
MYHPIGMVQILVGTTGMGLNALIHMWFQFIHNCRKLSSMSLSGRLSGGIDGLSWLNTLDLSNNIGLKGTLPSSIGKLKKLRILMLVGCSFFGPIPDSIGSLQRLVYLSLASNSFNGSIPHSIGNLSTLSWLDLSDNELTGTIPVSNHMQPGLDQLFSLEHFHLAKNKLSGTILPELFNHLVMLKHVILDHNQLSGEIPQTLGLVQTLEVVRLDSNLLNGSIPDNLNNLMNLHELYLSINILTGPTPNLTGMNNLYYLELSNNSFNASEVPPWFLSLLSLTTIYMVNTNLKGSIPPDVLSLPQLETIVLSNNNLYGTLDIGSNYNKNLTLDLQNNFISDFKQGTGYNMEIMLSGNPICRGNKATEKYCFIQKNNNPLLSLNSCSAAQDCDSGKIRSPTCMCSYPQTGTLHFFSYSFSNFENWTYYTTLDDSLMSAFLSSELPVDSVCVTDPTIDVYSYLQFRVKVCPFRKDTFNRTEVSDIGFLLNYQDFPLQQYGPYLYIADDYCCFGGVNKSSHTSIIVGVSVGASVLFMLIVCSAIYAFLQRSRAKRATKKSDPFASWDGDKSGSIPQLKGVRWFSFEMIRKCTDNFSDTNCIGYGGYGKVYRGLLAPGELVAIKRAQQGSLQGALEFKTEIELLSRIHHKNVVNLVGFCYEQGEQMLVYEYIPNGTLRESLSGKSGFQLNWTRRLKIALDAARGLAYLHELADPPIIHRDVKSSNILLDDNLNAEVADFGISKLLGDSDKGHVSTQVKGTFGYLDPEYYMTQQLTDRSDVYSFGVVLLELITAKPPIERGNHIVKVVSEAMDDQSNSRKLDQVIDVILTPCTNLKGLQKFMNLAMSCVRESAAERPSMGEVVREIENIIQMAEEVLFTSSSSFDGIDDSWNSNLL